VGYVFVFLNEVNLLVLNAGFVSTVQSLVASNDSTTSLVRLLYNIDTLMKYRDTDI